MKFGHFFTENNKIAEGENSEAFYFDTLITSPPSDLKCESSSSNSLKVTWNDPTQGMEALQDYAFEYHFDKGFISYLSSCFNVLIFMKGGRKISQKNLLLLFQKSKLAVP